ncbi:MAG: serine protease [Bacteroidia bacterium]
MNIDETIVEKAERYIKGVMTADEQSEFEAKVKSDAAYANAVNEYLQFYTSFEHFVSREKLKGEMDVAHADLIEEKNLIAAPGQTGKVIKLFRKNIRLISVAASVAIISVLGTALVLTKYYGTQIPSGYRALVNDVAQIKKTQRVINNQIKSIASATQKKPAVAGIYSGTSFLVTAKGYLITSLHIVNNANNIEVVNDGYAYNAHVIATNAACDFALLKIEDSSFESPKSIPYNFYSQNAEMGQKVFTLGYPRTDLVYGEGSVSSLTGYQDDTIAYQVSVPLNPGNSGGPLFDERGNIVGVISGKQMQTDAASFAIKSSYIVDALKTVDDKDFEKDFTLSNKKTLSKQPRVQQLKTLKSYIFEVRVIN